MLSSSYSKVMKKLVHLIPSSNTGFRTLHFCANSNCSLLLLRKPKVTPKPSSEHWHTYYSNKCSRVLSPLHCSVLLSSKQHELQRPVHSRWFFGDSGLGERLVQAAPSYLRPYLRLTRIDKPTGTFLLLWPCLWSIALSAEAGCWPSAWHLSLFTLGAFLMRGAGCTINDMWDKDIDSQVERTKHRPMASGDIEFSDALGFLAVQLTCATFVLLQLNWYSILLGFSSMALVVTYPLSKRYTYWPQLVLGLTFNWGVLLGWSSVHGSCNWPLVLPLYAAGISWTLVYDTIYAHQDRQDDARIGLKSTALLFEGSTKKWLTIFGSSMIGNLLLTGLLNDQTWPFYVSTGLVALHLVTQITTLNINNPENCAKRFKSNVWLGMLLFIGIVYGNLLKEKKEDKINCKR